MRHVRRINVLRSKVIQSFASSRDQIIQVNLKCEQLEDIPGTAGWILVARDVPACERDEVGQPTLRLKQGSRFTIRFNSRLANTHTHRVLIN